MTSAVTAEEATTIGGLLAWGAGLAVLNYVRIKNANDKRKAEEASIVENAGPVAYDQFEVSVPPVRGQFSRVSKFSQFNQFKTGISQKSEFQQAITPLPSSALIGQGFDKTEDQDAVEALTQLKPPPIPLRNQPVGFGFFFMVFLVLVMIVVSLARDLYGSLWFAVCSLSLLSMFVTWKKQLFNYAEWHAPYGWRMVVVPMLAFVWVWDLFQVGPAIGLLKIRSVVAFASILGGSLIFSTNIAGIRQSVVTDGILLMIFISFLIVRFPFAEGADALVDNLLTFGEEGAGFVFDDFERFRFAMFVLPCAIYFSAFIGAISYLGFIQSFTVLVSSFLNQWLKAGFLPSVNTAANMFLGATEAPLLVEPYLAKATAHELHCILAGGFAGAAASIMVIFAAMQVNAGYLLASAIITLPATIVVCMISVPPGSFSEESEERGDEHFAREQRIHDKFAFPPTQETNFVEAAGNGASAGIKMVLDLGAVVLSLLALLYTFNFFVGYLGSVWMPDHVASFESISEVVFWVPAWILGVPHEECGKVGIILAKKIFLNEFVAFKQLTDYTLAEGGRQIGERAEMIATFACTSYANFATVGTVMTGVTALCPDQAKLIGRLTARALVSGHLISFLTAALAGAMVSI